MPLTPGALIGVGKATQGLIQPGIAVGLSTTGLIGQLLFVAPTVSPPAPVGPGTVDEEGIPHLLNGDVRDIRFVEVRQGIFWHPDEEYTGYAADGFWYESGQLVQGQRASWAIEGEGEATINRGKLDTFPSRIFVITTRREVVILEADKGTVWMRFTLLPVASAGLGALLGDSSTDLRSADFQNGFLVVATNQGVRIADFRRDVGTGHTTSTVNSASTGLVNRDLDGYLDTTPTPPPGTFNVVSDDCRGVSLTSFSQILEDVDTNPAKNSKTVAAVGSGAGLSAITLSGITSDSSGIPITFPRIVTHPFEVPIGSAWSVIDDGDADGSSPLFTSGYVNWLSNGVRPGDVLTTDAATVHRIVSIQAGTLTVDPELLLTASGTAYTISRGITALHTSLEGWLYFAHGASMVALVKNENWYDVSAGNILPPGSLLPSGHEYAILEPKPSIINDLDERNTGLYAATDLGVYLASTEQLESKAGADFIYSVEGGGALYPVLQGEFVECSAVAVDPETGNVAVATLGPTSIVTEIDRTLQQGFRFFDQVGRVKALVAFRNPNGLIGEEG